MKDLSDNVLISLLNNRISLIYSENEIIPLRGFSLDGINFPYQLPSGKKFIIFINDILKDKITIKEIINISDDLLFLSDEIIYFTALLYLYQPFIENQIENAFCIEDREFFIADQTIEGKRYDMFVDILFEKIYSFYERIANIIALFFPDIFTKKENIHFSTLIDKLNFEFQYNDNFIWLRNFRNSGFKDLNEQRRNTVHNSLSVTRNFNEQRFENNMDFSQTKMLQDKRLSYADYFKQMHNSCLEGLERTLSFLRDIKE